MTRPLPPEDRPRPIAHYVGTLVGEASCRDFRLSVARGLGARQDLIALDAELRSAETGARSRSASGPRCGGSEPSTRCSRWRPATSSAETRTDPLGTVLSLSREMVTAVCCVLGVEAGGALGHRPATPAACHQRYRPDSKDIAHVVVGELGEKRDRGLDLAAGQPQRRRCPRRWACRPSPAPRHPGDDRRR
ncbi:MAG: hypothetical protein U0797_23335 [Gemmataceae bacterium]